MDRHALRNDVRRSSRARGRSDRRARARRQGKIPGAARPVAGQSRRVLLERGAADQHGRGADEFGGEPLQHPRGARKASAGLHQHDADDGLSRRRPPERVVSLGAAGRGGGARARDEFGQAAAAQPAAQGHVPAEVADRIDLRQRRSGAPAGYGAAGGGLGRLRQAAEGGQARGQAARHRACHVPRAVRRHGQGTGRAARRAGRPARDVFAGRTFRAGPRDGVSGAGRRRAGLSRGQDRSARTTTSPRRSFSAPAASDRAR